MSFDTDQTGPGAGAGAELDNFTHLILIQILCAIHLFQHEGTEPSVLSLVILNVMFGFIGNSCIGSHHIVCH